MSSRKLILGAVVLFSCVFLVQCTKQNKLTQPNQVAEIKNAVAAAQAGQFDKIDPKVMAEVMRQYKQPTLPPLTTLPRAEQGGCGQCRTVLAESQAPAGPVQVPAPVSAPAPSANTVVAQPPVASNLTPPPQEPANSYVHPIENKPAAVPQIPTATPAGTN